jgi:hypothetical protein
MINCYQLLARPRSAGTGLSTKIVDFPKLLPKGHKLA